MQITNSNWSFYTIDSVPKPEEVLLKIQSILDALNLTWYLGFGTALGFYRDKDFIPEDTDIDFEIITDDQTPIDDLIKAIDYPVIRTISVDGKYQQVAFQDTTGLIIDLAFFRREGKNLVTHHEGGDFADPLAVIGTPTRLETKYGFFPFPEKIEEYLTIRYGDWQTKQNKKSLKV